MQQFPLAEEATRAVGLLVLPMLEFEADDALASGARLFERNGFGKICIASPDKDLMQCVRGATTISWDRMRERTYGENEVLEKLGVLPQSVPDYLALVGDTADGIPGVPRWGAKSAASLLRRYEHLEAIPRQPDEVDVKVRGLNELLLSLREHEAEVLLYRTLATLRTDAPIPLEVATYLPKAPDWATLEGLLGFSEAGGARPGVPF